MKEALDLACSQLINEISLKVMVEKDDGEMGKKFSPPTTEELADYNGLVDSHNKTHLSSIFVSSLETPTDHAELGGFFSAYRPSSWHRLTVLGCTTSGLFQPGKMWNGQSALYPNK